MRPCPCGQVNTRINIIVLLILNQWSGGPWLKDTDTDGRGTVISINSWGYATVPGMAGPNFSTASGSKAECLFEVAKNTPFEDMVGKRGIVVDNC